MEIVDLRQRPAYLPEIARWHLAQWGYMNPGQTLADVTTELESHLAESAIPTTYVAVEGEQPLGSASLIADDMDTRPELSPWLASLYVREDVRRRGVGEALMRRVVHRAAELGIERLYLFTPDQQAYYGRRGWVPLEDTDYRGQAQTIMVLTPDLDY